MPLGRRILGTPSRPDQSLIERFRAFNSADISDAMSMSSTMDRAIQPAYTPMRKVVGPAVTIAVPTGSQNVRKMGMDLTTAGDVIVINGYGASHYALLGSNIGRGLLHRGVAGLILDGAFRDLSGFREMDLPIFSRGIATLPGPKIGPGEVNVPIACGNIVVNPGDIIVADEDGIVAVPPERAEEVLESVGRLTVAFEAIQSQLEAGAVTNIDSIRKQLLEDGFEITDKP